MEVSVGSSTSISCARCGRFALKASGSVNRSEAKGAPLYCGRECSGAAKRKGLTDAQKRANKAAYDAQYRAKNASVLKTKKAAHYAANVDRAKEAATRKARMPKHVEYCRRPEYRRWKVEYDKKYHARKGFGDFGEAAIVLNELEAEISARATWVEIRTANGTLNKHQQRRRDYERQTGQAQRG